MLSDDMVERLLAGFGDVSFGNRFVVEDEAGRGGMGVVYRGTQISTATPIAIKVMTGGAARDHERFSREADVLESLEHRNIVRYLEHGVTTDGGSYLVMEWLEGVPLSEALKSGREFSQADVIEIGRQLCAALEAAHALGVVHRDIKPSNVFLENGEVKRVVLLDFGIARRSDVSDSTLTSTGEIVGSPGYMSPEQIEGHDIDGRADLFSLGVLLYELLSGTRPFIADSLIPVLMATLSDAAVPLESLCPDAPGRVVGLVGALMSKQPKDRPPDATAVGAELDTIAAAIERDDSDALREGPFVASSMAPTRVGKRLRKAAEPPRRKKRSALAIAIPLVLGLGAVAAATVFAVRSASGPDTRDSGEPCYRGNYVGCDEQCKKGYAPACALLGEAMVTGIRRKKDTERGRAYLVKGCDGNVGRACYRLAKLEPKGSAAFVSNLEKGCTHKSPRACRALAMYRNEQGDRAAGLRAFDKGCTQSDPLSCDAVGNAYRTGDGVEQSAAEAQQYYRRACDFGYQSSCEKLR